MTVSSGASVGTHRSPFFAALRTAVLQRNDAVHVGAAWCCLLASRQFRFKSIVDDSGEELLELEHETRTARHFQYMKHIRW